MSYGQINVWTLTSQILVSNDNNFHKNNLACFVYLYRCSKRGIGPHDIYDITLQQSLQ